MSKEKIEKLEPVCEGCEDGACNIDFDTPTSYKEAYEQLKKKNDILEIEIDRLQTVISHRNDNIDVLERKNRHTQDTLKLALRTITLISDNIRQLDETLNIIHNIQEEDHE